MSRAGRFPRRWALGALGVAAGAAGRAPGLAAPRGAAHRRASPRQTVTLSTGWRFHVDPRGLGDQEGWQTTDTRRWSPVRTVPQAWDCYEEALWEYEGLGWFATTIGPRAFTPGRKVLLQFGRVMYHTKAWLNGELIGENEGGYLPFAFDVSRHLRPGQDNHLVLRVDNRPRMTWLPAGKQIEWIQWGGLLEPVRLTSLSPVHLADVAIVTEPHGAEPHGTAPHRRGARVRLVARVTNDTAVDAALDVHVTVEGPAGRWRTRAPCHAPAGQTVPVPLELTLDQAPVWSPDTPVLHTATVSLAATDRPGAPPIDELRERFGVRTIRVDGRRFLLNDQPFYVKGVHRYDFWGRLGPTPSDALVRQELALLKKTGVNTLRVHYPPSPEFLDRLDEFGFLLMEELPLNWWGWDAFKGMRPIGEVKQSLDILDVARPTLEKMIQRDRNHPCVAFWSMSNECETETEVGTAVMRDLLRRARALDPTRPATFVSKSDPRRNPAFEDADFIAFNHYVDSLRVADLEQTLYGPLSQALADYRRAIPDKPILVTEFGREAIAGQHGDRRFTEEHQAAYLETAWRAIRDEGTAAGGIVWTWADYQHRRHFTTYNAFGPYGVVTTDRRPKLALAALRRMFSR